MNFQNSFESNFMLRIDLWNGQSKVCEQVKNLPTQKKKRRKNHVQNRMEEDKEKENNITLNWECFQCSIEFEMSDS